MSVVNQKSPSIPELKSFAITISWAFPLFFSVILPWLFNYNWQVWPLFISLFLMTLYIAKPAALRWPYKFWMTVGGAIGWVNTRLILGLCFYVLIAPIGLVLGIFGKLQYKANPNSKPSNRSGNKPKKNLNKSLSKHTTDDSSSNTASNYVKVEAKSDKKNLEYPF